MEGRKCSSCLNCLVSARVRRRYTSAFSRGRVTAVEIGVLLLLKGFLWTELPIWGAIVRSVDPPSELRRSSAARVVFVCSCGESRFSRSNWLYEGVTGEDVPDFLPGKGRLRRLPESRLLRLPEEGKMGGSAGSMQGEKRYLIQSSTLKKSTGYFSFVLISTKQLPSSGSKTKLVRKVKLTCAVKTLELKSTASPFLSGPRMLTQDCGTPA